MVARFGAGQDHFAQGVRRGWQARAARDRALGLRDGIGGTRGGQCREVGARHGCASRVNGAAVHIISANVSERRRPRRRRLRGRLCPMRTSRIALMRTSRIARICTSRIAIGWCRRRRRHGTGTPPRDQEREQGQFEALVTVGAIVPRPIREALARAGSFLRRAHRPDERPKSEQYECAVEAHRPQQRHADPFRRFLDGVARSVLVWEPVLDAGAPELECNLKDLARALALPVVGRHPVGVVEAWIRAHVRRWVGCRMHCWR